MFNPGPLLWLVGTVALALLVVWGLNDLVEQRPVRGTVKLVVVIVAAVLALFSQPPGRPPAITPPGQTGAAKLQRAAPPEPTVEDREADAAQRTSPWLRRVREPDPDLERAAANRRAAQ